MRTLVALLLVPAAALAADVDARSRIDAVTVYRASARVTRVAGAEVPPGDARVVLAGLPDGLDDDSVRVEGRGAARVRLHGVTVERVTGAGAAAGEARAGEARLEALQDEDRAVEDRIQAAHARAKFVESLRSTYSEDRARNLALRPVATKEWAAVTEFVAAQLADAAAEVRRAEAARRDLKRRLDAARAALERLASKRGETTKRVAVEVSSDAGGPVELAVSYVVREAGWQPVWTARLAPATGAVDLDLRGSVWQRSGEDWSDVRLAVSTAQPGRGLAVPELATRWLERTGPQAYPLAKAAGRAAPAAAPPPSAARMSAAEPERELDVEVEEAQATVEGGLLAATFTAPRRATVDGAGQARQVALARFPMKAEVTRTAAPRADPVAFLTAKAVNAGDVPLLPGSAAVFVGEDFVGRAQIPFTPAGGELRLAFGADDAVQVDRRVLQHEHDTSGLLEKRDVWRYRVRTTVRNRRGEAVKLTLLDLVPVSRDASIEVVMLDGSTAATREDPDRPGVKAWELEIPGKGERVVELAYEVRAGKGQAVAGLE